MAFLSYTIPLEYTMNALSSSQEAVMTENPLLTFVGFPRFSAIKPSDIVPALEFLLDRNCKTLKELENLPLFSWENFVEPVSKLQDEVHQAWSLVTHLHMVVDSEAIRSAYMTSLPKITRYWSEFGQNKKLYQAYQAIEQSPEFATFSVEKKKVIENALRDFKLAGVTLSEEKRNTFLEVQEQLADLSSVFGNNVLDAMNAWSYFTQNEDEIGGLPAWAKQAASESAAKRGQGGWLLTLESPIYHAVITYCDNRDLRERIYEAHTTRASDQGPDAGKWDNSEIMEKMVEKRWQLAQLLGYSQYSEYSLATKMASSAAVVLEFLSELIERVKPKAIKEYEELKKYAKEQGIRLESWDIAYFSEKLREQTFRISQEQLRPYFPLEQVLTGLFEITHRLYGVELKELTGVDTWDKSVRVFEIKDGQGNIFGYVYLDLFARSHKREGAWMDEYRTRSRFQNGEVQHPMAYLVCNFTPPLSDTPVLLTHEEVLTLFHEFGHTLHHLLTRIDHSAISGTMGVPWDAIELPSQFFEHWAWESEGLKLVSRHIKTGEPLPEALITHLKAAKNFHSGLQVLRQLEFSIFDFRIHHAYDPVKGPKDFVVNTLVDVRKEVAVIIPPAYNRFAHSFAHIFAGGYSAAYYSYKWAEVMACDAFSLFQEKGIFNRELGHSFLHKLLSKGGLFDSLAPFVEFRGREPDPKALLRYYGIE